MSKANSVLLKIKKVTHLAGEHYLVSLTTLFWEEAILMNKMDDPKSAGHTDSCLKNSACV